MNADFFGDSYDAVKRLWNELLAPICVLKADPRFIPQYLQSEFTVLTGIGMLNGIPEKRFCILNDPDTGILPAQQNAPVVTATHVSLRWLADQLGKTGAWCSVTFDQAFKRDKDWPQPKQRLEKLQALRNYGYPAFYYVSHAPFLFAAQSEAALNTLVETLSTGGLPAFRLESEKELPKHRLEATGVSPAPQP